MMIDLEANQPVFYWTYEAIADYERDDVVWKADSFGPPAVTPEEIAFDYFSDD